MVMRSFVLGNLLGWHGDMAVRWGRNGKKLGRAVLYLFSSLWKERDGRAFIDVKYGAKQSNTFSYVYLLNWITH